MGIDTEVDLEELAEHIKELEMGAIETFSERVTKFADERVTLENMCEWGLGHKICPIAFGICKLQVSCCVIDEIVGVDDVRDTLEAKFGEMIQSIDVAAMNKA